MSLGPMEADKDSWEPIMESTVFRFIIAADPGGVEETVRTPTVRVSVFVFVSTQGLCWHRKHDRNFMSAPRKHRTQRCLMSLLGSLFNVEQDSTGKLLFMEKKRRQFCLCSSNVISMEGCPRRSPKELFGSNT